MTKVNNGLKECRNVINPELYWKLSVSDLTIPKIDVLPKMYNAENTKFHR